MAIGKPGEDESEGLQKVPATGKDPVQKVNKIIELQHDMPDFYRDLFLVPGGTKDDIYLYGHRALDDERSRLAIVQKLQELVDYPSSVKNTGKILFVVDCIQIEALKNHDFEIRFTIQFSNNLNLLWLISIVLPQKRLDTRVEHWEPLMVSCEMPKYEGKSENIQQIVEMTQLLRTLLPTTVSYKTRTEENRVSHDFTYFLDVLKGDLSSLPPGTPTVTREEFDALQSQFVQNDPE